MCFVKPYKVEKVLKNKVILENGMEAYYEKNESRLKKNDMVLVYGNVVINKIINHAK